MPDPRSYVVRDEPADSGRHPDKQFPYTLRGLIGAMDEARFRSFGDVPQVVAVREDSDPRVIRRFEHGREVPVAAG